MLSSEVRVKFSECLDRCEKGEVLRFRRGDKEYMLLVESGKEVLPALADTKEPVVPQKKDKKVAAVALREAEKKLGVEPVKFHSYF